jgi:hypothetical protein
MAGGTLLAVTKIVEPTFGLNLYLAIALPYLYISLIAIGFVLFGLGLWRLKMKLRQNYLAVCFCFPLETYHILLSSITLRYTS